MEAIPRTLDTLPVELLYEIYLFSLSESFPQTNRRIHAVFCAAPSGIHAEYILGRHLAAQALTRSKTPIVTRALRFPLCSESVLDALLRHPSFPSLGEPGRPTLPRRLFRTLEKNRRSQDWRSRHAPLPFLEYLYTHPSIPAPDIDSHDGYPLAHAVRVGHRPLIDFLLAHGADPGRNGGLAVKLAIQRRDLQLLRVLVEPDASAGVGNRGKRRRVPDRVVLGSAHLRVAVQAQAAEVCNWLMREKGCVPDMKTFGFLRK
ncbi:hypothetical protein K488DRAFT_77360 [Vararia minispora EC-137]|uniref:Uncharacterized protein n=1 Tax=Vararia minispora EC-137 TaxID=1314806 RepID=A0ACB8QQX6_9AGAM|nr:hypothetical protein K488DRAFT_77360 [Vararia minispora EC-137]